MLSSFPSHQPSIVDSAHFIVIGSGIAGLYSALELSKIGSVILITKSTLAESNTSYAQGGIASALDTHDSPELHYQDTIMAGAGLCNSEAVLALVYDGPKRVKHLIELGVPFDRDQDNQISLTREAAHSRRRILHADGDATGREISKTLIAKVRQSNIKVYENCYSLALATNANKQCRGVVVILKGELKLFLTSAVILCTGGLGQIYGKTTNPSIATGDGMALAYNTGAALRDLEFIQFHPTALYLPPAPPFLISETVRGEGAILLNSKGQRFMPDYHPLAELAPRDIVARAIFAEIQRCGTPSVFLDLSKLPPSLIKERFPNIYETCLNYGLDITTNLIPVAPAAHYVMGGVVTNLQGQTSVSGLFAAGEVAATGVHGANRLASNSLLEGLVFAGRIADYLSKNPLANGVTTDQLQLHYPQLLTDYDSLEQDLQFLHEIMDRYLGIVRTETDLVKALNLIKKRHTNIVNHFELNPAYFELQNMYALAQLMLKSALTRVESRGGHFRSDYPNPENDWRKHIVFKKSDQTEAVMEVVK